MDVIYSSVDDLANLFKALADETRLKMLYLLSEVGEAPVQDLQKALRIPQPTVSRHLGFLARMGILDRQRRGRLVFYFIIRQQSGVLKEHINLLKSNDSFRRIFQGEMRVALNTVVQRRKARR